MLQKYADIIIDISHEMIDHTFQYKIPYHLMDDIKVGSCVLIPFGTANKLRTGYVIGISDQPKFEVNKLKEIEELKDDLVPIESSLIQLASYIKKQYGSTMINALKTVMPVKKRVKQLSNKYVCLIKKNEELEDLLINYKKKNAKAKIRLLSELIEEKVIPYQLVTKKLNISTQTLQAMQREGVVAIQEEKYYRNISVENSLDSTEKYFIEPNLEQQYIIDKVNTDFMNQDYKTYLLKGITGSGKTLVYIEIIKNVLKQGKQAIVLIPEIALTYQNIKRFRSYFGSKVTIINSKLSFGERYDQFEKAKRGDVSIMIGPRSALFAPFNNLGIIIIDEEHETTYKNEYPPKYHTIDVAIYRAKQSGASVLLGSATPSVTSYQKAINGEYELLTLNHRANQNANLANVTIVDLRKELKNGNRGILSNQLKDMIQDRLDNKEQTMLFINRRGYNGFISCRSCGYVFKCPHCDISLTEHFSKTSHEKLVCHYCGFEQKKPMVCPQCKSKLIAGFGIGTQKVEEYVKREFPDAKVLRMDMDTTKKKDGHEKILSQFSNGEVDILIGTQMIVKGHDFENVTLVGAIAADLTLFDNDYLSSERTFDLLTQAAGRAGRGKIKGDVIIQTYDPNHYAIATAAKQNYEAFYKEEKSYREMMLYPPFSHFLVVFMESNNESKVLELSEFISNRLTSLCKKNSIQIIGPCDATISKIKDRYRRVVYLKHIQYNYLIEIKDQIESLLDHNVYYKDCFVSFDFDPTHAY